MQIDANVRDARAWLAVRRGDVPLVPAEVAERGTPAEIVAAGLARLNELRDRTNGLGVLK